MKKKKTIKPGNLISSVTDGKINSVEFGGDISSLGFSAKKWNEHYDQPHIKAEAKRLHDLCNEKRKQNGLDPI